MEKRYSTKIKTLTYQILIWLSSSILTASLISCNSEPPGRPSSSSSRDQQSRQPPETETPDPQIDDNEFCFANYGAGVFCLPLYKRLAEYDYKEPTPENDFPQTQDPSHYHPPTYLFKKSDYPQNQHVSKNFKWGEFFTNESELFGLVLPILLESLQEIRDLVNGSIVVNSAYRSPKYNNTISGSAKWSRHIFGDAVDFWSPSASLKELKLKCEELGASYIQLYTTHIHCDWRTSPKGPPLFPTVKSNKSWQPELLAPPTILVEASPSTIKVTVSNTHQEDESTLLYEWTITNNDDPNKQLQLNGREIRWPRTSDSYEVHLVIGGNITIRKTINLKDLND